MGVRSSRDFGLSAIFLVLIITAGVVASVSLSGAAALAGGLILILLGLALGESSDLVFAAVFVAFSAALVDAPNSLALGNVTLSSILSVAYLGIGLLLWLYRPGVPRDPGIRLFALLFGWALLVSLPQGIQLQGTQNLVVLALFVVLAYVASARVAAVPSLARRVWDVLELSALPAAGLYSIVLLEGGLGSSGLVSARTFGLFALVPLSVALANARYRVRWAKLLSVVLLLLIAASLSRTALLAAVVITALAWTRPSGVRGVLVTATLLFAAGAVAFSAFWLFPPLQQRLTTGDLVFAGGVPINTSGRVEIWHTVWDSYLDSPLIGQGAGSSEVMLEKTIPGGDHPHNDYLRILHDYGLVGFVLLLAGLSALIAGRWRAWKHSLQGDPQASRYHLGALLLLVSFAITMLTDNTLVYTDVMGPLALILGLSVGYGAKGAVVEELNRSATAWTDEDSAPQSS
jgi:O-antigen ligase